MKGAKTLAAASALVILGAGGITAIHANSAQAASGPSGLIDRLVARFNLNRNDVQAVLDEEHNAMHAEREQMEKDRLAQAVTDGKLTQAQADLIIAKHEELEKNRESLKDKTPEERRAAMKTQMDDLKKWADDNNIPLQYLHPGMGKGKGGFPGPHGNMMGGMRPF